MIKFTNLRQETPYLLFKSKYDEALNSDQKGIEAISISSYSSEHNEVDSRYVNLKFITSDKFIFFSNYNSPKASSFDSHRQISVLIYWNNINLQIRMKAKIEKTSNEFNQNYFSSRSEKKNALAISSRQSCVIESYNQVKENYKQSLENDDLKKCPEYWGGYSFTPYYFEFWEGHSLRLNKRNVFKRNGDNWDNFYLEP